MFSNGHAAEFVLLVVVHTALAPDLADQGFVLAGEDGFISVVVGAGTGQFIDLVLALHGARVASASLLTEVRGLVIDRGNVVGIPGAVAGGEAGPSTKI